jgi:hypothetical protein
MIPNTDYLPKMVTRVVSDSSFCLVPPGIIFLERSSGILYEAKIEQNWLLLIIISLALDWQVILGSGILLIRSNATVKIGTFKH